MFLHLADLIDRPTCRNIYDESKAGACEMCIRDRLKAVLDALNGVAYRDDSQVVEVRVVKHDRTRKHGDSIRFEVEPIPENELV